MRRKILTTIAISALGMAGLAGCRSSAYYGAMDKVGYEKREMLMDRLQEARDSQVEAKQQLETALYSLRRVDSAPASELSALHDDLESEVDKTAGKLGDLRSNIAAVESVARSMFDDWEDDLAEFQSDELRAKSQAELQETRRSYSELIANLRKTEQRLQTVIAPLQDQVLFIEHAANAGDTPPASDKLDAVREQVSSLIEELDDSIDRTQKFIAEGVEAAA